METIPASLWSQLPVVLLMLLAVFVLLDRFEKFISRMNTSWQEFIKEQEKESRHVLDRLTGTVTRIGEEIVMLRREFSAHDLMERELLRHPPNVIITPAAPPAHNPFYPPPTQQQFPPPNPSPPSLPPRPNMDDCPEGTPC